MPQEPLETEEASPETPRNRHAITIRFRLTSLTRIPVQLKSLAALALQTFTGK